MVWNTILEAFGIDSLVVTQKQQQKFTTAEIQKPDDDNFISEAKKHRGKVYMKTGIEVNNANQCVDTVCILSLATQTDDVITTDSDVLVNVTNEITKQYTLLYSYIL